MRGSFAQLGDACHRASGVSAAFSSISLTGNSELGQRESMAAEETNEDTRESMFGLIVEADTVIKERCGSIMLPGGAIVSSDRL